MNAFFGDNIIGFIIIIVLYSSVIFLLGWWFGRKTSLKKTGPKETIPVSEQAVPPITEQIIHEEPQKPILEPNVVIEPAEKEPIKEPEEKVEPKKEPEEKVELKKEPEDIKEPADEQSTRKPSGSQIPDCVIFDLETSSINKNKCAIIEIGAVRVRAGEITDKFSTLVSTNEPIDPEASAVNGITKDMLASAPLLSDTLSSFLEFIGNDILAGYNIKTFDIPVLKRCIFSELQGDLTNEYIDMLPMARKAIRSIDNYKLTTIAQFFDIPTDGAHRAINDCEITFKCFSRLCDLTEPKRGSCCDITVKAKENSEKLAQEKPDIATVFYAELNRKHEISGVSGKTICLTGDFISVSRSELTSKLSDAGAIVRGGVSGKTDYLLVGSSPSVAWKYGHFGTKIERALDLINEGKKIQIVCEEEFLNSWQ